MDYREFIIIDTLWLMRWRHCYLMNPLQINYIISDNDQSITSPWTTTCSSRIRSIEMMMVDSPHIQIIAFLCIRWYWNKDPLDYAVICYERVYFKWDHHHRLWSWCSQGIHPLPLSRYIRQRSTRQACEDSVSYGSIVWYEKLAVYHCRLSYQNT